MSALVLEIVFILVLILTISLYAAVVLAFIYVLAGLWGYSHTIKATGADRE